MQDGRGRRRRAARRPRQVRQDGRGLLGIDLLELSFPTSRRRRRPRGRYTPDRRDAIRNGSDTAFTSVPTASLRVALVNAQQKRLQLGALPQGRRRSELERAAPRSQRLCARAAMDQIAGFGERQPQQLVATESFAVQARNWRCSAEGPFAAEAQLFAREQQPPRLADAGGIQAAQGHARRAMQHHFHPPARPATGHCRGEGHVVRGLASRVARVLRAAARLLIGG
mmetsp:Transcript_7358/g.27051  ORF Transcript_7358/g.27051 Transcript_7358/m.27051 type:complete len:226 (+) Transcript_7358:241-918(+)